MSDILVVETSLPCRCGVYLLVTSLSEYLLEISFFLYITRLVWPALLEASCFTIFDSFGHSVNAEDGSWKMLTPTGSIDAMVSLNY